MMGPRSVGKTTVLTSIFHESQSNICEGSSIYLKALDENTSKLNDYHTMLVDAVAKKNASNLPASNTISEFLFGLGLAGRSESVKLKIRDFPGEYLTSELKETREEIYNFISNATVILIAVDTPYLMEENGRYNEEKNKVEVVSHFLKDNVDVVKDKLVLFVPLKCERYFHDGRLQQVSEATKRAYSDLTDFFAKNNIASFVTPIITLGGIEFDHMQDNPSPIDIQKISVFRPWDANPVYKPLFCPQPLYYLLTYVTNYYEWQNKQKKGFLSNFMSSFYSYIKDDSKFYEEMKKLTRFVIYNKNGFVPITTNSILKIN
jgi:GTPase SAR1 family protein